MMMKTSMKTLVTFAMCGSLALGLTSCGDHDHTHGPGDGHDHPAPAGAGATKQSDHGASKPLGSISIAGQTIAVTQEGEFHPGKELGLDLTFPAGVPMPTVRAWVGVEDGTGSMKLKLGKETETVMHGHVEVPDPVPAGSKIWFDVETAAGSQRLSLALPQ